jgi:hypothetical protein
MTIGALNVLNQNPNGFFLMSRAARSTGWAMPTTCRASSRSRSTSTRRRRGDRLGRGQLELGRDAADRDLRPRDRRHLGRRHLDQRHGRRGRGRPVRRGDRGGPLPPGRGHLQRVPRGAGPRRRHHAGHQWASGNHTNELVPLWAMGAGSELFAQFARPTRARPGSGASPTAGTARSWTTRRCSTS